MIVSMTTDTKHDATNQAY